MGRALGGEPHADGEAELHVGDPRFDDWEVVRDFGELEAARAWRQYLGERERRFRADRRLAPGRFGRGDIALRVPPGRSVEAERLLDET